MSGYREEALPFITYNSETRKYILNEEAVAIIRQVPKPIGIISVAGAYRTGKSYLLNRMILNRGGGFGVGPTVNPCTKGIWVWGTPIKGQTAEGEPVNLLIMDSEGIGSTDEDQTHDTRVFSLAILLASNFIYNSMGSIDENALNNLSLVVNLTKNIHIKSSDGEENGHEDYSKYFPSFFWVIRDFSLQLVDTEGEPITSNEYLEKSLQEQKGISDEVESKNRIRRLLTTFFQQRECMTLVRPLVNEKNLQKLDQMELDDLRPEFFEQVLQLRKKILNRIKPKTLNGKQLNGEMVMTLCDSYVRAINNGAVPNIENAWTYVCKDECYKAGQKAFDYYEKTLKEIIGSKIPTSAEDVKAAHRLAKEGALEIFKKWAIGDVSKDHLEELNKKIKTRITMVRASNEKESVNECSQFIQREFATIERKLKANQYRKFSEFEGDIKLFYGFLVSHGPNTVNRNVIFLEFLQKAINDAANIFTKNLESEIDIQRNCSLEVQKRSEAEMSEMRKKTEGERNNYERKIEQLTKEKDHVANERSKNEKAVKEIEEEKSKMEREFKELLLSEKTELSEQINTLKNKFKVTEENLKKVERELLLKESSFQKEKALLEQRASHFETLCEEYLTKDKANENMMQSTHSDFNTQLKEHTSKYDRIVRELELKLSNLREINSELSEKLTLQADSFQHEGDGLRQRERTLLRQIEELQTEVSSTKRQLSEVSSNGLKNLGDLKDQYNDEFKELKSQNQLLTEELTRSLDKHKSEVSELRKREALLSQQMEFVKHELEESKNQLLETKRAHESTLQALEINNFGDSESSQNKQYLEMKETHMRQLKAMEQESILSKKTLTNQIENLTKELQDIELKYKVSIHDYQTEVASLTDQLSDLHQIRSQLTSKLQESEDFLKLNSKDMEKKYIQKIRELEDTVEAIKDRAQSEIRESQTKSEESLQQLKNMFEIEKETLEKRLIEEKEKRERSYNQVVEEYEQKLREEQQMLEEEIENLRDDNKDLENQNIAMQGQYEHELDLKQKSIDNLEKVLAETKMQLANSSASYQSQLEQQMASYNADRKELQLKYETTQKSLQLSENKVLTTQQKLESTEASLENKKRELAAQKQEYIQERQAIEEKFEETRKRYQELSDEHLQTKINSEKNIALSSQQNEFFQKKVQELEKQLDSATQRFEERLKTSKIEWAQETAEKIQSLQDEKVVLETRLNALKKQTKESEAVSARKVTELEKEKAITYEKLTFLEGKLRETDEKYILETEQLKDQLAKARDFTSHEKKVLVQEIEKLKSQNVLLDNEKHELNTSYERDKVLWEGKFSFLQQQKEQAKSDLIEAQKKFEQTLTHLQKQRQNEKSEREQSVSEMLMQIEKKYQTQISELQDSSNLKLSAANQKITKLEAELKTYQDQNLFEQRQKNSNAMFTEKRLIELTESERRYQMEIESLRKERDIEKSEAQQKLDSERDALKLKIIQSDEKFREAEKKRNTLIFEHEKERAKWNQEKDYILNQKNEMSENLNKAEKKKDILLRENERLKGEARQSRRQLMNTNQPSFLNMSRNMGSSTKSPLRSTRSRERSSLNDYSYASNGVDLENDNNSEGNTNNILENLNLNSSRENSSNLQSTPPNTTVKSFQQVLQEKGMSMATFGNENKPPTSPSKKENLF